MKNAGTAAPKKRVLVAMSGGVDSSLTAALLLQQGYDVIGATMQIWEGSGFLPGQEGRHGVSCCSVSAIDDARRVAAQIGIPHYVLNFRQLFQQDVIDYFLNEYAAGRTPNPCIACNRRLKFKHLLHKALELEADYVATGHYARIKWDDDEKRYKLLKGIDAAKDQSYALFHLNQATLARFLFPLGELTKVETRSLAKKLGLKVADKPDSQEICFVPGNDYRAFFRTRRPEALVPGDILDVAGNKIGTHNGLALYTVGQRRGLGLAAGRPLYVVALDSEKNAVIVGDADKVFSRGLIAGDVNFISSQPLSLPCRIMCKIRYNARESAAILEAASPTACG